MDKVYNFYASHAEKYGINQAIILYNIMFWIEKNKANHKHYYEERYWTYNSVKAFTDLFPFFSEKQVRTALDSLVKKGILLKGNFNKKKYDRTAWYSIALEGECNLPEGQMDLPEKAEGFDQEGEPIPDSKPDIKNIYIPIVEYLNEKSGKSYKPTTVKTKECINARLNEGFILEDFKKVIDVKVKEWKGDSYWEKFLRPETLFSNKFEGYLNQYVSPKEEYIANYEEDDDILN